MKPKHLLIPAALAFSTPAFAASDEQLWAQAAVNVSLSPKWRVSEELVTRFSDKRNGLYEIESSTLLTYRLNKTVSIGAGYVHDPLYLEGDLIAKERRLREQVTFDNIAQIGKGKVSARLRAEQRWRDHVDGTGWRLRPYAKYSVPLKGKLALNLSNETFVNLNKTSFQGRTGIDRMRNLVTLGMPLSKQVSGEIGYLNQHGFVKNGPDTSDNVAYFALSLSL